MTYEETPNVIAPEPLDSENEVLRVPPPAELRQLARQYADRADFWNALAMAQLAEKVERDG